MLMFSSVSFADPVEDYDTSSTSRDFTGEEDYSFYKMASAASMFYNASASPGQSLKWGDWENVNAGIGAGFMGFSDANKTKGVIVGIVQALTSISSASISYDALVINNKANVAYYAYYGAALKNLGVDSMLERTGFPVIVRFFAGLILILAYIVSMVPNLFFKFAIHLLRYLNIFSWASEGIKQTVGAYYADAVKTDPNSPFAAVGDFVSKSYGALYNFAMDYTFPILVVFGLFILLFKSTIFGQGSKAGWWPWMKKTFVRFMFIGWGFAVMGYLVSSSFDFVENVSQYQPSVSVIKSHFIDFEAWFTASGLALPSDSVVSGEGINLSKIKYDTRSGQVVGEVGSHVSEFVDKINENSVVFKSDLDASAGKNWNAWAFDVLVRYMNSEVYKPSDFESYIKATLLKKYGTSNLNTFKAQFENADEPKDFESLKSTGDYLTKSNYSVFFATKGNGIEGSGIKSGDVEKGIIEIRTSDSPVKSGTLADPNGNKPMSYIGLYNYLCTEFGSNNLTIFSQEKASSDYVKRAHASVNIAGQGFMPILSWIEMFTQLLFLSVIGIGYAMGMFFSAFKRQMSAFIALPFAMFGFMGMIAKVIGAAVLCVVELIGTMILYNLFSLLITDLSTVLSKIINGIVTVSSVGSVGALAVGLTVGSVAFPFIVTLIATIITIIFNIKMMFVSLSLRRKFIDAVDELLMKLIDKIFLIDTEMTGGGASLLMADGAAKQGGVGNLARGVAGNVIAGYGMYQVMNGAKNALNGNPLGSVASGGGTKEPEKPLNSETTTNHDNDVNISAISGNDPNNLPDNGGGGNAMIPEVPVLPDNSSDSGNTIPVTNGEIDSESADIKQAGENVLEKNSLSDSKNESGTAVEAKTGDAVKDVASGSASASSAVIDAKVDERASEIKNDAKKAKATAGVQTIVGGAKVAGGVYTGNAALAADGAKDVAKAGGTLKNAENAAKNVDAQARSEIKSGAPVQGSVSKEAGKSLVESGKSLATAGAGSVASSASGVGNVSMAAGGLKSVGSVNVTEGAKTVQGNTTNVSSALNRNSANSKLDARVQSGNTNVSAKNSSKATVANTANVNASKSTKTIEGNTVNDVKTKDLKSGLKASTLQKAVDMAKTVDQKLDSETVRNIHRGERIVEIGKSVKPEKKVVKKTSEFEKNLQQLTNVDDSPKSKKTPRKK